MVDAPGGSKLLIELGGQTVLSRSLRAFQDTPLVDEVVLVAREEHIERFRELAEAAIDLLIERGWAATTAVAVCERAGVTRGALLHHYDDLGDLLLCYEGSVQALQHRRTRWKE